MKGLRKTLKANRGMRQKLAADLGVDPITVYRWATGVREPKFDRLVELSDRLGISIDTLIRG